MFCRGKLVFLGQIGAIRSVAAQSCKKPRDLRGYRPRGMIVRNTRKVNMREFLSVLLLIVGFVASVVAAPSADGTPRDVGCPGSVPCLFSPSSASTARTLSETLVEPTTLQGRPVQVDTTLL